MSATAWSTPIRRAAPPAEALYSRASPGAPWLVSDPIARPYFIIFDRVRPIVVWIAAVPALDADPEAPAGQHGAPTNPPPTVPPGGPTAYGGGFPPASVGALFE